MGQKGRGKHLVSSWPPVKMDPEEWFSLVGLSLGKQPEHSPGQKTKVELGICLFYYTIMPETTLKIGLLLDYKASRPLARTGFKHVFQACLRVFVY